MHDQRLIADSEDPCVAPFSKRHQNGQEAEEGIANDQQGPPIAEDVETSSDCAILIPKTLASHIESRAKKREVWFGKETK